MARYDKDWKSIDEQLVLLVDRGLPDAGGFRHELETIGYYRLSGYWYNFRQPSSIGSGRSDTFVPGASMASVVALYQFDEQLRRAVWNAISPIELAVRAAVGHQLGKIDAFSHLERRSLHARVNLEGHATFIAQVQLAQRRSHEEFVRHFHTKYDGTLPVWVVTEILQFGQTVKLYEFAAYERRRLIAEGFGARADELLSWLRSLNIVRNVVAHHGRLWNRSIGVQPQLNRRSPSPLKHAQGRSDRIYGVLAITAYLLRQLKSEGPIAQLRCALSGLPEIAGVTPAMMKMPDHWQDLEIWQVTTT